MSETVSEPSAQLENADQRRGWLRLLGPGLITGAADDDPSGIATYSQAGAQFGYGLGWTMLFTLPLLACIQEISARIGRVTGRGIAANLRAAYPSALVVTVSLLTIANAINLGADLGAMGEAVKLLLGGAGHIYVILFGLICALVQIFVDYARYVRLLKWLTLSLFAYVAAAFMVAVPWSEVARQALVPKMTFTQDYLIGIVAVFGTTIAPYLIFWQAGEEVEELALRRQEPLRLAPARAASEYRRIRIDTYLGIGFSNLIGLFIIVTTAATLNANGITDITSAAQAAEALRPIAGPFAFAAFALGIIGTGLLAVPVLAGSSAYAVGEALGRPVGLGRRPADAKTFYGLIAASTLIGVAIHFAPIDPMKALFWSAVLNGVLVVPIMIVTMIIAGQPRIMGTCTLPPLLRIGGWLSTVVMAVIVVGLLAPLRLPSPS